MCKPKDIHVVQIFLQLKYIGEVYPLTLSTKILQLMPYNSRKAKLIGPKRFREPTF
jgi:hypothetical protein